MRQPKRVPPEIKPGGIQSLTNDQLAQLMNQVWECACKFDSIDPSAKFVVFSENNKWARIHITIVIEAQIRLRGKS